MKLAKNDLYPEWVRIDRLEQSGEITVGEAQRLKHRVFEMMDAYGVGPDDLVAMVD